MEKILSISLLEIIKRNENLRESKQIIFLKEFLDNQNSKKIALITLEEINKPYLQKLSDYLNKESNLDANIKFINSENNLEECNNSDFSILFTSINYSSYSDVQTLKNRFKFLKIDLRGFVLIE